MRISAVIASCLLFATHALAQPKPPAFSPASPYQWSAPQSFLKGEVGGPWTTSTRPSAPTLGLMGYNSTISAYEIWNGSAWQALSPGGSIMSGSVNGIGRPDSLSTTVSGAGIFSVLDTVQPPRTAAITFIASDMSTLIPANTGVSGITISPTGFAATVFGSGQTACVENNTTGALPISNTSGAQMFPAYTALQIGETLCLTGDGANLYASVGKAPVSNVASGGTGLASVPSGAILAGSGTNPLHASNLSDTGVLVSSAVATVATPFALPFGSTITPDGTHDNYSTTLTGPATVLNPTVMTVGQNITFQFTQDATGGRVITWSGQYVGAAGAMPLPNLAANSITLISCRVVSASLAQCYGGAPVQTVLTLSKTANYTVLSADSGASFNNLGASGEVDFTLPAASTAGLTYCFTVDAAQSLKLKGNGADQIAVGASNSTATTGSVSANAPFATLCIYAYKAAQWVARASLGTWTVN